MRHRKSGRKLGRVSSHRKAMLKNMTASLLKHERIITTDAKAKELRSVAERVITLGKNGSLHARRQTLSFVRDRQVTAKVFDELSERYSNRSGGYTRIIKIGYRDGDNAPLSVVELISEQKKKTKEGDAEKSPKDK
ncbi:MAG: 50S ribosomal protein L17 [Deltaproteobacteria bacterium]|nr:50S ribosomal protein L17 [Deltaproteobacteria bacterium]